MIANLGKRISSGSGCCTCAGGIAGKRSGPATFQLHSTTFSNDGTLPISTILNNQVNGVNTCTINGAAGDDESPRLSWTGAPRGTQFFVVVLYDVTASFTHWGMYNISGNVTQLPENAGEANSPLRLADRKRLRPRTAIRRAMPTGECYARYTQIRFYGVCLEHETSLCRARRISRRTQKRSTTD